MFHHYRQMNPVHNKLSQTDGEWLIGNLEALPLCPVCGGARREKLHADLQDRIFFCAPGKWQLHSCLDCGAGFLDPRPNLKTIGEAYRVYYTHEKAVGTAEIPVNFRKRFRVMMRNGYLNAVFGQKFTLASSLGRFFNSAAKKRDAARWVRHLHFPEREPRLLDVGCGNGAFLAEMRAGGWDVYGVEPDPNAVAACQKAGLMVKQGMLLPDSFPKDFFAAITLNHVIEHLHDPIATLRLCHKFLRPGGTLWIATPNLQALGHTRFGRNWFALDPPRHLVLFTPMALKTAFKSAGFATSSDPLPTEGAKWLFRASDAVAKGRDPLNSPGHSFWDKWRLKREAREADRQVKSNPELTEELVMMTTKQQGHE
jgi:2-polyprenyl-3-methyl-5-hydroxy-6-metoxy-1,4-benzoquinol methylase